MTVMMPDCDIDLNEDRNSREEVGPTTHQLPLDNPLHEDAPLPSKESPSVPENGDPIEVSFTVAQETRNGRKRRTRTWNLRSCECGISIEDRTSQDVIKCKNDGCETELYHIQYVGLERGVPNWRCRACKVEKRRR
ncbi:hypothetical protein EV421DRAFT_1157457 [Armillaria borealis]|uniref:Zinc finger PHD-type domain-containing protein n=1 Tax=Armillaria borealis TaxID=47425 RepID=A0AA39J4B5_9AGAR|nr:hypothetical protein EV421DRAFT_1157457 [Armillaria borealis]